jgi:hypothetical protein
MVVVYILFGLLWGFKLLISREHLITIHTLLTALWLVTALECVLVYLEYDSFNRTGKRGLIRTMVNILVCSLRSTLANLVFLLIALGFGTVMNKLGRYLQSIGIVAFLLFVSTAIYKTFFYIS